MCKFVRLDFFSTPFSALHYIPMVLRCYCKYSKYLQDDFAPNAYELILSKIPYLWIILTCENKFMGFVYLDNWLCNKNSNYSVELTTCFEKEAWGSFTGYSAKFFLKYCFDKFGLYKIRALIYPQNFRISQLLKKTGFKYEATLPSETLRKGKLQDIDCYALYRNYYYKNEVKKYD